MGKHDWRHGITAATICFMVLAVPYSCVILVAAKMLGPRAEIGIAWLIGMTIFGAVAAVLGYGVARRSIFVIAIASLMLLAVVGAWIYAWVFDGFGD